MSLRKLIACLCILASVLCAARAVDLADQQAPLVSLKDRAVQPPGAVLRSLVSARRALELGFPSVAAGIYEQLIATTDRVEEDRNVVLLELVTAYLNEGRIGQADKVLRGYVGRPTAAYHLRASLVAIGSKRFDVARNELGLAKFDALPLGDRSWWHFIHGQLADEAGDFPKARDAYQRAADVAVSEMQRAYLVLAREQARLSLGETSDAQLNTLRQGFERYQGKAVGYAYARQYAALLATRGRVDEAVDFLNKQLLALPDGELGALDDFRLLLGVIAGVRRVEGRSALEALLTKANDVTLQRVALQLLVRDGADAAFFAKLNTLINARSAHPLLADMLLVRAQIALTEKQILVLEKPGIQEVVTDANRRLAEEDAKALLAKFPGSELKPAALGVLADLAWDLRRYRTAADYAAQARRELPSVDVRAALGVMIAEAYFRAGDYVAAEEAYLAALAEVPAGVDAGVLIAQRVICRIQAGRLYEAAKLLDDSTDDARLGVIQRWRVEWTLACAFQADGRGVEAYARVNRVIAGSGGDARALPAELRARMAWLQARLALDADQPQKALELATGLKTVMENLDTGLRAEVEAGGRLLQAKAKFRLSESEEALKILASVRADYPQADAAVYSYIDEADYYVENDQLRDAQARLIELASKFKLHAYAPYALYRSALIAEQRGLDQYYEEAYRILEDLVTDYPGSSLVFYARLKQGNLARKLNDFPRARLTYEFLINNFSQHPEVLSAELALAACHRAQITLTDVSHYESALTILERLQDLPNAPQELRIEAGFQLGDLLATKINVSEAERAELKSRAEGVWWTLVTNYLLDNAQAEKLGPKGRYWLARALVRFGDSCRESGRMEEARNAYEIVFKKNLPFAKLAQELFARSGGKL